MSCLCCLQLHVVRIILPLSKLNLGVLRAHSAEILPLPACFQVAVSPIAVPVGPICLLLAAFHGFIARGMICVLEWWVWGHRVVVMVSSCPAGACCTPVLTLVQCSHVRHMPHLGTCLV
jgi:hypothetical protein